ncbi:MAG TPA: glycosyltransferase family 25 protein [Saprospiraceae bacterium]|nr:glycosyltransferase family 25 protein [Saprospiraceae bacterium]HPN68581.1 glycosyltransferase family 25 protein [Saprospiraceae bacterium]
MVAKLPDFAKEAVYIIHAINGYEAHEARIRSLFPRFGLSFKFITQGDPSLFSESILEKYFVSDIKEVLSPGVLSCTLNHILAYEELVKSGLPMALIFENDPYFLSNFEYNLQKVLKEAITLPPGFIISLENSTLRFPSYWQKRKEKYLYLADNGRMAGAYLIDLKAAQNALNDLRQNKCKQVIDWWHNELINRGVVKMYWAHPPLTEQGSHNGLLHAGISSKKSGIIRQLKWKIQKVFKYYLGRLINQAAIQNIE